MMELILRWGGAKMRNQHCMLVMVEVKNVFNSLRWDNIIRRLEARQCDKGLVRLVSSYLNNRRVTVDATEGFVTVAVYAGVPQGSTIGPILWKTAFPEAGVLVGCLAHWISRQCYGVLHHRPGYTRNQE